jgi:hypothetical protein
MRSTSRLVPSQAITAKLLAFGSMSAERFAVVIVACLDEGV